MWLVDTNSDGETVFESHWQLAHFLNIGGHHHRETFQRLDYLVGLWVFPLCALWAVRDSEKRGEHITTSLVYLVNDQTTTDFAVALPRLDTCAFQPRPRTRRCWLPATRDICVGHFVGTNQTVCATIKFAVVQTCVGLADTCCAEQDYTVYSCF